jgi:hypothetical protein
MVPDMMSMYDTLIDAGMAESDMQLNHHADGAHSEWFWAREYPEAYLWLFDDLILSHHPPRIVKDFIYPNPADKFLRIQTEMFDIPYKIYSPVGNVILSSNTDHDRIDISHLLPGLYLLEIKAEKEVYYISRFIKQ